MHEPVENSGKQQRHKHLGVHAEIKAPPFIIDRRVPSRETGGLERFGYRAASLMENEQD